VSFEWLPPSGSSGIMPNRIVNKFGQIWEIQPHHVRQSALVCISSHHGKDQCGTRTRVG